MLPTIATGNVGSALAGGYEVDNSLRFNDGSSDFLSKTFGTAGNQQKMTISFWIKRSDLSGTKEVISQGSGSACHMNFQSSGTLEMNLRNSVDGGSNVFLITNRLFRDVSAWYHIVLALDTTQGTASNRAKLYVNGVQETSFGTENYPSQNGNLFFNEASAMQIGEDTGGANFNYDGYMAEFVFINAEQLAPTSFGEFDEDSGIWKPIDVSGLTFGTNGFYLDFENSGSLGADVSGNGNNFTVNNLTSIDQSTDTCTNNFATLNPLGGYGTFSEGNLKFVTSTTDGQWGTSTISLSSGGKWYCEVKMIATDSKYQVGLTNNNAQEFTYRVVYRSDGVIYVGGSSTSGYSTYTTNDIIGMAFDSSNREITFYKNGSSVGTVTAPALASSVPQDYFFGATSLSSGTLTTEWNYGNPPYTISSGNTDGDGYGNFEYAVPSGYYSLNTKNLAEYG